MKNVSNSAMQNVLILDFNDFCDDLKKASNNTCTVKEQNRKLYFSLKENGEAVTAEEVFRIMSEYYECGTIAYINVDPDGDLWVLYHKTLEMKNTEKVIEKVKDVLMRYPSDNVDVVKNEMNNKVEIIFHSRNNSFTITSDICRFIDIDKTALEKELDELHVGHCW